MSYEIHMTSQAQNDLCGIFEYIAFTLQSPQNAAGQLDRLEDSETFFGKIVLSASLKDFSARPMRTFQPNILLKDKDSLSDYGINASIVSLPGHTNGSIGIDVDNKYLLVGDALMNMFYPTVSMLYHNKNEMLESARKMMTFSLSIRYLVDYLIHHIYQHLFP